MTTISRLNTTISDHTMAANYIALCLLISGAIVGTVALRQSGELATAYDALFPTTTTTEVSVNTKPATTIHATPQTSTAELSVSNSSPLSVQDQPQDINSVLQPANDMSYLQPTANSVQLTGTNLQNARGTTIQ